jgi:1-phosphofructokinase
VTVFGPHPILSITIERRGESGDDIHLHSAGQGVWVARMVAELGAEPVLCSFVGGETGELLMPLLEILDGELRSVHTAAASGSYVIDRRSGERDMIAHAWSEPPSRHEIDDLFSTTCAAALESQVLVVCGPVPQEALPLEFYGNLVVNARANGTMVVVDLSAPRLQSALAGKPDLVKVDEWQLAEFLSGPVSEPEQLRAGAEQILALGARSVVVTRGGDPALLLHDGRAWELVPPHFEGGASEGSGDSMVGGLAAARAHGLDWQDALRVGAAAGATNFLRHGLGSGKRETVESLVGRVELRALE